MESLNTATIHIPAAISDDPLLSNRDLARRWQCSPSYIEKKRPNELPPRCSVLPGRHRYRLSDVLRFEASMVDPNHPLTLGFCSAEPSRAPDINKLQGRLPLRLDVATTSIKRRTGRKPVPAMS
jgi:hypothetical protein